MTVAGEQECDPLSNMSKTNGTAPSGRERRPPAGKLPVRGPERDTGPETSEAPALCQVQVRILEGGGGGGGVGGSSPLLFPGGGGGGRGGGGGGGGVLVETEEALASGEGGRGGEVLRARACTRST